MKSNCLEIEGSSLPVRVKVTGKGGHYEEYVLKPSGKGVQLIGLDPKMQQLFKQC